MSRLATTIEAILYLKAQALTLAEIAEVAACDRDSAEEGLLELMADYAHRDTALEVAQTPDGYSLQLKESFQNLVQSMIPADIGKGSLRTLAVIALKGPIVQSELINLRGSTAYQHVQDLVEQGFVKKRQRAGGRSPWLQVTEKFNQYFQLDQLPGNIDQLLGSAASTQSKGKDAVEEENLAAGALGESGIEEEATLGLEAPGLASSSGLETPDLAESSLAESSLAQSSLAESSLAESMESQGELEPESATVENDDPDAHLQLDPEKAILTDELLEIEEAVAAQENAS
jgi:segregation and condensation protein B